MEKLIKQLEQFLTYLYVEKNASELTIEHYRLDVEMFIDFLKMKISKHLQKWIIM